MAVTPSTFALTGRLVVVTGAARGIGAAIATACAHMGADLALCDRDEPGLASVATQVEATGRLCTTRTLDVRDGAAVEAWIAELDRVDVLVNNAGGGFAAAFLDVRAQGQEALVAENFTSVTNLVRACVPKMTTGGGAIVNITSIEAHRAAPGYAVYAAMKAAVANLTQSLALELADRRIRVNCIAPDMIPTPGIGGELPVTTPLPYAGHADDVAAAAVYLASDAARFVTGVTLHVDGGNLAAGGWRRTAAGSWEPGGTPA